MKKKLGKTRRNEEKLKPKESELNSKKLKMKKLEN
tara:strand:+ start:585 stop:689 length:105 start_codon:yes stop_codon:yes gene_type:complete